VGSFVVALLSLMGFSSAEVLYRITHCVSISGTKFREAGSAGELYRYPYWPNACGDCEDFEYVLTIDEENYRAVAALCRGSAVVRPFLNFTTNWAET